MDGMHKYKCSGCDLVQATRNVVLSHIRVVHHKNGNSVPVPIVVNLHPPIVIRTDDMFTGVERIKNIFIKLMLCLDAGDVSALYMYMYIVCQ